MIRQTIMTLGTLLLLTFAANAQDTLRFTLHEAVQYAVAHNPQLKGAQLNEDINEFKIQEVKAAALPQVSGSATGTDNFKRASQLLPGEMFGQPGKTIAVQFGTRFAYNATLQVSQTVFNPSINIGLKAARESQGLYRLQTFKNKEDLIYNVISVYLQLQMSEKQRELMVGNIARMNKLVDITNAQFKEGIIKKVDVSQIQVNYTNLQTQLSNTNNTINQLLNNLKTLMNLEVDQPIAVAETGIEPVAVTKQLMLEANTDLNILEKQIALQKLNTDNIKAGYLPTLGLSANYGKQWQTNELLKQNATTGFVSGFYSLNLQIPIFDGFARRSKIKQSNLAVKQLALNKEYLTKSIESQFTNASNNLTQNQQVLQAQAQNMKVAEDLYQVANLSYTEGIAPLTELINAENALKEAQVQYLTAMLQMNVAELDVMQTSGQLSQLIQTAADN